MANEGTKGQQCKQCNQHGLAGLKICEPDDPAEPPLVHTTESSGTGSHFLHSHDYISTIILHRLGTCLDVDCKCGAFEQSFLKCDKD